MRAWPGVQQLYPPPAPLSRPFATCSLRPALHLRLHLAKQSRLFMTVKQTHSRMTPCQSWRAGVSGAMLQLLLAVRLGRSADPLAISP